MNPHTSARSGSESEVLWSEFCVTKLVGFTQRDVPIWFLFHLVASKEWPNEQRNTCFLGGHLINPTSGISTSGIWIEIPWPTECFSKHPGKVEENMLHKLNIMYVIIFFLSTWGKTTFEIPKHFMHGLFAIYLHLQQKSTIKCRSIDHTLSVILQKMTCSRVNSASCRFTFDSCSVQFPWWYSIYIIYIYIKHLRTRPWQINHPILSLKGPIQIISWTILQQQMR